MGPYSSSVLGQDVQQLYAHGKDFLLILTY